MKYAIRTKAQREMWRALSEIDELMRFIDHNDPQSWVNMRITVKHTLQRALRNVEQAETYEVNGQ